jgi:hypothetical protein
MDRRFESLLRPIDAQTPRIARRLRLGLSAGDKQSIETEVRSQQVAEGKNGVLLFHYLDPKEISHPWRVIKREMRALGLTRISASSSIEIRGRALEIVELLKLRRRSR